MASKATAHKLKFCGDSMLKTAAIPSLSPFHADGEETLASVTKRMQPRRDHAHVMLAVLLGGMTDARLDTITGMARNGVIRDACLLERMRRDALDCPYAEHVEENPYNGVVLCHGCGITLHTFAEGEY